MTEPADWIPNPALDLLISVIGGVIAGVLNSFLLPTESGGTLGIFAKFIFPTILIAAAILASKALSVFERRDTIVFGLITIYPSTVLIAIWILSESELLQPTGTQVGIALSLLGLALSPLIVTKSLEIYFRAIGDI